MKLRNKILTALAVCTISVTPLVLAGGAMAHPGKSHGHSNNSSSSSNAHAYGKLCQSESKKHVTGMKGTPFSECVTAMAHLAHGTTTSPAKACATESKKHVAGMKGTPFSECVTGGKQLLASKKSS